MIKRALFFVPVVVVLHLLTGCENSLIDRSLIFATHTTLGLEVAVGGPAETAVSPVKLIVGYKRSEGVLNPVYDREYISTVGTDDSGAQDKYRKQAYSVVAKLVGETKASAGSQVEGAMGISQWFATGRAADIIARNDAIAAAVTGNTGIAEALAKMPARAERLEGLNEDYALIVVGQIYNALGALQEEEPEAEEHVQRLDLFASLVLPLSFTKYKFGVGPFKDQVIEESVDSVAGFTGLISFIAEMKRSVKTLTEALAKDSFALQRRKDTAGELQPVKVERGDEEHARLSKDLSSINKKLSAMRDSFVRNETVVGAVTYYIDVITGRKQEGSTRE